MNNIKFVLLHMPFESITKTYLKIGSDVEKKANHMMNYLQYHYAISHSNKLVIFWNNVQEKTQALYI